MISREELITWNKLGLFPGPLESDEAFLARVEKALTAPPPPPFMKEALDQLEKKLDMRPEWAPVFFSAKSLYPWMPACTWFEEGELPKIQLHPRLESRETLFFGRYRRSDILAHELVHVARAGFDEGLLEEMIAYDLSPKKWTGRLASVFSAPWETGLFLLLISLPLFGPLGALPIVLFSGFLGLRAWRVGRLYFRSPYPKAVRCRLTFEELGWIDLSSELHKRQHKSLRYKQILASYF